MKKRSASRRIRATRKTTRKRAKRASQAKKFSFKVFDW